MNPTEIRNDPQKREAWPYCEPLMCGVHFIGSGIQPGVVLIDMVSGDCTDMRGAIRVCEALWPGCHEIKTCAGGKDGTSYVKRDGQWIAVEPLDKRKAT